MAQNTEKIAVGGARVEAVMIDRLELWIRNNIAEWNSGGVDTLQFDGMRVLPVFDPKNDMRVLPFLSVYVGTVDAVNKNPLVESDFVKIDIDAEMSFVHAMVLIETAVEGVGGRK